MKFFAIAAFAIASLFAVTASASSLKDISNATFKLYSGSEGICSTTFIRNDKEGALFLTAAHCVDQKGLNVREQVIDQKDLKTVLSERVYYVKAVKTLKSKDIALLQTLDKNASFFSETIDIATPDEANTLTIGDELLVAGYPAAEAKAFTKGLFTGKVAAILDWDAPVYQTTVAVAGGNSGGALYAQFGGTWKLIGTTSAMRRDNSIMTYFQTAETVAEALKGFTAKPAEPAAPPANPSGRTDEK